MAATEAPERRLPLWAEAGLVLSLTALGAAFRFAWFSGRMIERPDEVTYWLDATHLLHRDASLMVWARPLHTMIQATSLRLFGVEEWALRLPMAVLATLTIPLVYLLARRLFGILSAAFAAFAFAVSAPAIESARSALAESDALFFLMAGTLVYLRSTHTEAARPPWRLAAAGLLLGLSLLCHPVTLYFVLVIVFVAAVSTLRGPTRSARLFSFCVLLVAISLPGWIYDVVFAKLRVMPGWTVEKLSYYERVFALRSFMETYDTHGLRRGFAYYARYLQLLKWHYSLGLMVGLGLLTTTYRAARQRDVRLSLPALLWIVPIALWAWVIPMLGITRNVYSALAPQSILVGVAAAALAALPHHVLRRRLPVAGVAKPRRLHLPAGLGRAWPPALCFLLLLAITAPSRDLIRTTLRERKSTVREAYDVTRGWPTMFYPAKSVEVLGRFFAGRAYPSTAASTSGLIRLEPSPRFAVYYAPGPLTQDWVGPGLNVPPIVDGRTTGNGYTVRVYDLSVAPALWRPAPVGETGVLLAPGGLLAQTDGWEWGESLGLAKLGRTTHLCRKTLSLPVGPRSLAAADLQYYIQINPFVLGRSDYLRRGNPDPRVNLLIDVNDQCVLSQTVAESATQGWHTIPISPRTLKQGSNEIIFRLSEDKRVAVSLGVNPAATSGRSSSASSDGGASWTSDIVSPEHIFLGKPMPGEYIVRLLLRPKDPRALTLSPERSEPADRRPLGTTPHAPRRSATEAVLSMPTGLAIPRGPAPSSGTNRSSTNPRPTSCGESSASTEMGRALVPSPRR